MTVTIWPRDWSFQTFLWFLAACTIAFIVGVVTADYMFVDGYRTGWDDAKHVFSHQQHPQHQGGRTP